LYISSPQAKVESFINWLSSRARYGIRGEKPIAVIAALQYLQDTGQKRIRLLELIENPSHLPSVRDRFIDLAGQYGSISNPRNSWSVITGSNREIQRAIEAHLEVDEAFSNLTKEQISTLFEKYIDILKRKGTNVSKKRIQVSLIHLPRQKRLD